MVPWQERSAEYTHVHLEGNKRAPMYTRHVHMHNCSNVHCKQPPVREDGHTPHFTALLQALEYEGALI